MFTNFPKSAPRAQTIQCGWVHRTPGESAIGENLSIPTIHCDGNIVTNAWNEQVSLTCQLKC